MTEYREGLNFIPILAQNLSPPISSRSRMSIGRKRSQRSFISFNGNYEGDISMFKEKSYDLERLNLEDTESDDNDLHREAISTRSRLIVESTNKIVHISLMWRLLQFIVIRFFKPEVQEKIFKRCQHIKDSFWFQQILKCFKALCYICAFILYFAMKFLYYLAFICHLIWKRRLMLRNMLRSILWWLTLAKCSDLALFSLTLVCLPAQFVLALLGFIIAICGYFKDLIQNWSYTIKFKLI